MTRSLIAVPLRLGLRGAGIAMDGFSAVAGRALGMAALLVDVVTKDGGPDLDLDGSEHDERPREPEPERREPEREKREPERERREPDREAPAPAPTGDASPEPEVSPTPREADLESEPPAEPDHVAEEPTLVEEVAEPGAEDGAGAEVHVAEPWDGYREMAADDVIDRITGASSATLAAVELFELSHRNRKTVITAVRRELARADQ
jgi:hypothetical protein